MKALFWQWTLITTLCLAAQCIASPFDNSKYLQVSWKIPANKLKKMKVVRSVVFVKLFMTHGGLIKFTVTC